MFEGENMQTENTVLGYRADFCLYDYKLPIEIDENGHSDRNIGYSDRNINYEIKRQKQKTALQEFDCDFIRNDPKEEYLYIFKAVRKYLGTLNNLKSTD